MNNDLLQNRLNQIERQLEQTIATYNMMLGAKQEVMYLIRECEQLAAKEAEDDLTAKGLNEVNVLCTACDEPVEEDCTTECEPACIEEHVHECQSAVNS